MENKQSQSVKVKYVEKRPRTNRSIEEKSDASEWSISRTKELQYLRDLNAIASNQLYEMTIEKLELNARVRDLEFENKRLDLENTELLNRIEDHFKVMDSLRNLIHKHTREQAQPADGPWTAK